MKNIIVVYVKKYGVLKDHRKNDTVLIFVPSKPQEFWSPVSD